MKIPKILSFPVRFVANKWQQLMAFLDRESARVTQEERDAENDNLHISLGQ